MKVSCLVRFTAMLLIPALLGNTLLFAASKPIDAAAMKAKIEAHGVGQGVRVTLAGRTEVKGVILSVGEQSFTLKEKPDSQPRDVAYAQLTGVHNEKMGTGTKVILVVAIAGAAIGIVAAILVHKFHTSLKGPVL